MVFALDDNQKTVAKLKVIGVGGAGGNAVNRMAQSGLQGVELIAVNTDAMALEKSQADSRIQIGSKLTGGLGAGSNPQVGMMSMQEDRDRVRERLEGADMVFIAAGMGGGTGTGAAPVVAELAREMGILTVAVVTKPFVWEGPVRERNAQAGLDALRRCADTVIVVPNQKLLSVVEKNTSMRQAFTIADEILSSATRGISEIILKPGEIQVDFADVRTIMSHGGDALMGMGRAAGENRATIAMDRAVHSPLLENVSIAGATGVLVNFTGNEDMGMMEVHDAMNSLYEAIGTDAQPHIIFGMVINPEMKDEIAVTVIATGFGANAGPKIHAARPAVEPQRRVVTPEYRPIAQTEIQPEATERPDRFFSAPRPKAVEESNTGKIPLGAARPVPRPAYVPQPRAEEVRATADSADTAARGAAFGTPQRGRFSESNPDIDYETPAFLRNQVD